ncbi:RsmF rRNA methyltransferase first C-terminal domain-containing protein [Brevibacillus sp. HD1.4A]|uniref:RsmF rRNA methyltransferase first C-terminal domain-containing protein n=1 Tax=Brevibacillus sp. HD1.4A TaxID=2738978 RepID=UPI00156BA096|nr:RsmB/NOP family class I SAM-dependent RNA methyltransferase [Brevibacillus sp. HD1.4A]NRQ54337.1 RsmF rRNA methyltransferase first C-terminal domain-containing protein [Brevibacillus sp. HD1.4A]
MTQNLPGLFTERMKSLLNQEFAAFLASYDQPVTHGLRVNPLKVAREQFLSRSPFALEPIPWCVNGFRYQDQERPGKHPYHAAGLYYLQEPSAMSAVEALDAQPGERILDLCAAPGGKSTQLAAGLNGQGLLVANEIHPVRVKALAENLERCGVKNAVVTNETPEKLQERFPQFFDKILVDAPCSGEGMFRKLPEAIEDWSPDKVTECHLMQQDILDAASAMLKPGGTLVYSTCTFAPLENEQSLVDFLTRHPEFTVVELPEPGWFAPGQPDWANPRCEPLGKTARLWPHLLQGEGHYLAKLQKSHDADSSELPEKRKDKRAAKAKTAPAGRKEALLAWRAFAEEAMPELLAEFADESAFLLFGEQLYYSPLPGFDWDKLKVARVGLHLGTVKKNRLEPAHALALASTPAQAARVASYASDDPQVVRYLKGEALARDGANGWTLVTVDGFSLGWGKQSEGQLKNHYPKGLRWL